jgi:phosphotransferase system IIB component
MNGVNTMTDTQILLLGIVGIIVAILLMTILILVRKKRSKLKIKGAQTDMSVIKDLIHALGGIKNILGATSEHQRLKMTLKDPKSIDTTKLKSLGMPAVLAKNDIKVLIKGNALEACQHINDQRNGEQT